MNNECKLCRNYFLTLYYVHFLSVYFYLVQEEDIYTAVNMSTDVNMQAEKVC